MKEANKIRQGRMERVFKYFWERRRKMGVRVLGKGREGEKGNGFISLGQLP